MSMDYKKAGVDVEAGYKAVQLMKKYVQRTYSDNVLGNIGSFSGVYSLSNSEDADCLVAGTDGVGTKLKYAFISDIHDTIGIDAVAMCVNDIVCQGAKPLIFLDYIALPKLEPEKVAMIVKGVSEGCIEAGCSLLGGETAEMPNFYQENEYDIAGFSVGIVKKNKIITGNNIKEGDVLIGLASSGIHSNGFSLVRKLFGEDIKELSKFSSDLNKTYIEELLTPTKIYVKSILKVIEKYDIKGISHITGGGFIENIPRILPAGLGAIIDKNSFDIPVIFKMIQEKSKLDYKKMCNIFNMGIGMVLVVKGEDVQDIVILLKSLGEKASVIGRVVAGEGVVL